MGKLLNESAWKRGWEDTKTAWKSLPFIVLDAVVCVVVGAVLGWYWGLGLFVFAMLCAWIGATASAPVRQRNEVRKELQKLSQTPLNVDFYGYSRFLVGKSQLLENQYVWKFPVGLTNTSDKDNIGIKTVSLLLNFNAPDGRLRGFPLLLIPENDKDKYGNNVRERGRPLTENEYLHPHEPLTGFYQFLEEGLEHFGIEINKTWPTLILQDSLDKSHRKEFKRKPLIQSNSDKGDSQTE